MDIHNRVSFIRHWLWLYCFKCMYRYVCSLLWGGLPVCCTKQKVVATVAEKRKEVHRRAFEICEYYLTYECNTDRLDVFYWYSNNYYTYLDIIKLEIRGHRTLFNLLFPGILHRKAWIAIWIIRGAQRTMLGSEIIVVNWGKCTASDVIYWASHEYWLRERKTSSACRRL